MYPDNWGFNEFKNYLNSIQNSYINFLNNFPKELGDVGFLKIKYLFQDDNFWVDNKYKDEYAGNSEDKIKWDKFKQSLLENGTYWAMHISLFQKRSDEDTELIPDNIFTEVDSFGDKLEAPMLKWFVREGNHRIKALRELVEEGKIDKDFEILVVRSHFPLFLHTEKINKEFYLQCDPRIYFPGDVADNKEDKIKEKIKNYKGSFLDNQFYLKISSFKDFYNVLINHAVRFKHLSWALLRDDDYFHPTRDVINVSNLLFSTLSEYNNDYTDFIENTRRKLQ